MFAELLSNRRSVREFSCDDLSREVVERLIWAGQGMSDDQGSRTTPSAHALYPLRLFLTVGNVCGLETGLYSIDPVSGGLQLTQNCDMRNKLEMATLGEQPWVGDAACIVSVCADFVSPMKQFAEQPPFGRRGPRYVYIEAGAAGQNMHLQAVEDKLGAVLVAGINENETSVLLGLEAPLEPVFHMCFGAIRSTPKQ